MQKRQQYNYFLYKSPIMKSEKRASKIAKRIITILQEHSEDLSRLCCLDIGCSAGTITEYYGKHFEKVFGIDVDKNAIEFARKNSKSKKIKYQKDDIMNTKFSPESFDMVVGIGIYSHVPNAKKLFETISYLLKKGGVCYLQARNRFSFIDRETGLFMINFLPAGIAKFYARLFKKDNLYYEGALFLPGLKKLVKDFIIHDYTLKAIRQPQKYHLFSLLKDDSFIAKILAAIASVFYFAIPNYMWVLEKR